MMIKPGISELSKCVDSRYTLVTMAAKRARMIGEERMHDMDAYGDEKPVSVAAEEIVEGKVGYVRSEAIKRAKAWEDEKAAAILSLNSNDDVQPEEVEVEAYFGTVNAHNEIITSGAEKMELAETLDDNNYRYSCELTCRVSGRFGLTARIKAAGHEWDNSVPGFMCWPR